MKIYYLNNNDEFNKGLTKLKEDLNEYKKAIDNSKYISNFYTKDHVYKMWDEFYTSILKDND